MSKPIEWSPRSRQDYFNLLDYLQKEWGENTIKKFNDRLQSVLKLISERPEIYPSSSQQPLVRRCVLNKQTSLYYRIREDKIELITLFNNRQDPSRRTL